MNHYNLSGPGGHVVSFTSTSEDDARACAQIFATMFGKAVSLRNSTAGTTEGFEPGEPGAAVTLPTGIGH